MTYDYAVVMKYVDWSPEKNEKLKEERGVTFDEVIEAILGNGFIGIEDHPNIPRYGHQKVFVVCVRDYVYLVPFVQDKTKVFLKTIFPNRKATKKYMKGGI